jgi:hypothetical protein
VPLKSSCASCLGAVLLPLTLFATASLANLPAALTLQGHLAASSVQDTDNDIPYQASRLIGRWRTVMNNELEASRAFAAEEVTDEMEIFVSPGAVRAAREKAAEDTLKKADAALVRFVRAMVKAGTRQPDGSVVVEASAIEPAERAICPVYPFCD